MRFIDAELKNFCQHKALKVSFHPGTNLIVGANGAGKSNFINALRFALTNDIDLPGVRASNITSSASESDVSYVRIAVANFGKEFRISRGLRPVAHELHSETLIFNREGDVRKELETRLGPRNLLDTCVFIPQGKTAYWLQVNDSSRVKWFADLCGVANCETVWEQLGPHLSSKRGQLEALKSGKPLRYDLVALRTETASLKSSIASLKKQTLSEEEAATLKDKVDKRRQWEQVTIRYLELERQRNQAKSQLDELEAALSAKDQELQELSAHHEAMLEKYTEAKTALAELRQMEQRIVKRDGLAREEESLLLRQEALRKEAPARLSPGIELSPEEVEELAAAGKTMASLQKVLEKAKISSGACPTCLRPLGPEEVQALLNLLEVTSEKAQTLRNRQRQYDAWQEKVEAHKSAVRELSSRLKAIQTALEQYGELPDQIDQEEVAVHEKVIGEFQQLDATFKTRSRARSQEQGKLDKLRGEVVALERNMEKDKAYRKSIYVKSDDAKLAQSALDADAELRTELSELMVRLGAATAALAAAEQEAEDARIRAEKAGALTEWIKKGEELRSFFHRSNGPKEVVLSYLQQLEDSINENLSMFDRPFTVRVNDKLEFVASKDGVRMPASRLSGGEQVLLSLCFWFAVHDIFASDLGTMVLDEPTAFLDHANVMFLVRVFDQMRRVVQARSLQLIVVTHEREFASVFDRTIAL